MSTFSQECRELRHIILDIFEKGGRGHVPSAFSLVEILNTLYFHAYDINPQNFKENNRDKILLSKGHGCLALYAVLFKLGFFDESEFPKFCKINGLLGGHPTRLKTPGVEVSSGSLGHGPSIAVGKALSLKKNNSHHQVTVIVGDGECNEGSVWEAALSANKNKLDNFTIIVDYNKVQSYGPTEEVCPLEPFTDKWRSFGFDVHEVDMVNNPEILLEKVQLKASKPKAIICHTIKGQGNTILENDLSWHHKNKISSEEIIELKKAMI